MVVHVFPVAKLGTLLLKQISKPIANLVKEQAKSSPVFRKYVCLPPAQFYNWCEVKTKMWLLHLGQPVNIEVLNEAASIDLGANLLGEAVIFIIAAGILLSEYNRSSKKEAAKEAAKAAEMEALHDSLKCLFIQTEEQGAHIRELTRKLGDLETRIVQNSREPKRDPPPKDPPTGGPPVIDSSQRNQDIVESSEVEELHGHRYKLLSQRPSSGLLFKALSNVESDFLHSTKRKREQSILAVALNQLCNDVYRIPMKF